MANALRVNAVSVVMADAYGPPLAAIFQQAVTNGITLSQMEYVRNVATSQSPVSAGAILACNVMILDALAAEGWIVSNTTFVSRNDVEATRQVINAAFAPAEETIADSMDATGYLAVLSLHAAIGYHLTLTAQPLPLMLNYAFAASYPSLVVAQKLYADASRADELREENDVIHPAFMPLTGQALSS